MGFDYVVGSVPPAQAKSRFEGLFLAGSAPSQADPPKPSVARVFGTTDHPPTAARGPLFRRLPTLRQQFKSRATH